MKIVLLYFLFFFSTVIAQQEIHQFQAQTGRQIFFIRLMDIIINSLYSHKQIFLRQVISNSADALDKIRFKAITDPSQLDSQKNLEIRVQVDQTTKAVIVRDTGIGMTRQELIKNLGTVAKSGTTNFMEALKSGNINLIGQFGVGFYSTFLVGYKVRVSSKSNDDEEYVWQSEAANEFKVYKSDTPLLTRGTEVKIFLKEDTLEFLRIKKLEKIIKKYSEFINFPIYLRKQKEEEELGLDDKPHKKIVYEWQQLNKNKALWLRDPDQIDQQQYQLFYKINAKIDQNPVKWIHFKVQGEIEFTALIYIPAKAPDNFYANFQSRKNDVKIYVRRVLIRESDEEIVPKYLGFVSGLVDSDDLPLIVNRESLQQTKLIKTINQKLTKKIIDLISDITRWDIVEVDQLYEQQDQEKLSEQQLRKRQEMQKKKIRNQKKKIYQNFYREFGKAIKLGIIQDATNRKKLAPLGRWYSTTNFSSLISLDQYVSRMHQNQDQIYYFSGENRQVLRNSPLVKGLVTRGYEVLLCDQPVDQYVFNNLKQYEVDKKTYQIVNVGKKDFKLPQEDDFERKKIKYLTEYYKPLIQFLKKTLLERVMDVQISNRLIKEPCVVVSDSHGFSSFMERIQKTQISTKQEEDPILKRKRILQINPHHKLMQYLLKQVKVDANYQEDKDTTQLEAYIEIIYETAALESGYSISNVNKYSKQFYKIYSKAMGVQNLQRKEIQVESMQSEEQQEQVEKTTQKRKEQNIQQLSQEQN